MEMQPPDHLQYLVMLSQLIQQPVSWKLRRKMLNEKDCQAQKLNGKNHHLRPYLGMRSPLIHILERKRLNERFQVPLYQKTCVNDDSHRALVTTVFTMII